MSGTFKRENFYEWGNKELLENLCDQILTLSNESQQIWGIHVPNKRCLSAETFCWIKVILWGSYNCYHYFYAFNVNHRLVRHELWIYERTSLEIWLSFAIWHKCIGCRNIMYNFQKEKMVVILVLPFFAISLY